MKLNKAKVGLQRREIELNRELSINALHSEEAIGFLQAIPAAKDLLFLDQPEKESARKKALTG